ncbi:MAG: hypothetical protein H0U75_05180 [Legionella sp.]|nr:hypothetical protein [Legionella sp.]
MKQANSTNLTTDEISINIKMTQASVEQEPVIAQLYELYTYEMTDLADFDIHDNGQFGYSELPIYWQDTNKYPYLIWANPTLTGNQRSRRALSTSLKKRLFQWIFEQI